MQLPYRKAGKYTNLKPDHNLTEAKFNELKNKLKRLKSNRPELAKEVKRLAEMGDFSENAAYQIAKGRLRGLNQRVLEIENHLNGAVIIKPNRNLNQVQLGSKVTIKINGREKTYLILGSSETNPGRGIISARSPLGASLMDKTIGSLVGTKLAGRDVKYEIIKIE